MQAEAARKAKTAQTKKPAIAPYHQTSESPGLKNHIIAATKPDIASIEYTIPGFFVSMFFDVLREIVKTRDSRNRHPAKPSIAPSQNAPVA